MFGSSATRTGVAERAITSLPWGVWGDDEMGVNTSSGVTVTTRSALQQLAVSGCNRFICDGISTLPIDVFRGEGDEMRTPGWIDQPTADLDSVAWRTQVLTSLLLDGNAVCRVEWMESGTQPREVVPIDPSVVSVRRDSGRKTFYVNGQPMPPRSILHIPGVMWPGTDWGLSPVEAARQAIGKGVAVEDFAGKFFSQGANLSGVIEDPGDVDPEKAKLTARVWARLHSGNRKAHLPGVLQGGMTWKTTGVTNEQAQFLETHQFTQAQIAAFMFLIDPTEFGVSFDKGSSVTYANLEQRNARKVQVTFLPWIIRIERALTALLPRPQYVKINVAGLLRGDTLTRFQAYETASRINTAAVALGMDPFMETERMRALEDFGEYAGPKLAPPAAGVDESKSHPDLELIQGTP